MVLDRYQSILEKTETIIFTGHIEEVRGLLMESRGPQAKMGELCQIIVPGREEKIWAEVVGFKGPLVQLMSFTATDGICPGAQVLATGECLHVSVSEDLRGRVLDSMGRPMDGENMPGTGISCPVTGGPPDVLGRLMIEEPLFCGVRALDGLLPFGKGQRMGIFSGSGVGKTTLMGMIARNTEADVNVIALIGERGREVREAIENDLGPQGLARSVVIVSSSNEPPLARMRAAYVATTIAEFFRDQGKNVMFLFDSVTRFARAYAEIAISTGEPPGKGGYPPSMDAALAQLLERCGTGEEGTISAFYTVLVDSDDINEPISDKVRGILDGHLVLSRALAEKYHYPAIDVLGSVSRLANKITSARHKEAMAYMRRLMAIYSENEDLINVGAYVKGTNPEIDLAIDKKRQIDSFLQQQIHEKSSWEETLQALMEIAEINPEEDYTEDASKGRA